jgi:hypothetical protein
MLKPGVAGGTTRPGKQLMHSMQLVDGQMVLQLLQMYSRSFSNWIKLKNSAQSSTILLGTKLESQTPRTRELICD